MERKELFELKLKDWFWNKQTAVFQSASVNGAYCYEVKKETEKAIQILIYKDSKNFGNNHDTSNWTMWMPKSAIENLETVLA